MKPDTDGGAMTMEVLERLQKQVADAIEWKRGGVKVTMSDEEIAYHVAKHGENAFMIGDFVIKLRGYNHE